MSQYQARIRGGVCFVDGGWRVVVDHWRDATNDATKVTSISLHTFQSEAVALKHYMEKIRPVLIDETKRKAKTLGLTITDLLK